MPSSRGSSWPKDRTHFSYSSCIAWDSLLLSHREGRLIHIRHLITNFWMNKRESQIIIIGRLLSISFYLKTKTLFSIQYILLSYCKMHHNMDNNTFKHFVYIVFSILTNLSSIYTNSFCQSIGLQLNLLYRLNSFLL